MEVVNIELWIVLGIIITLILLFVLLLIIAANLAVTYALIPGSGAEKREILDEEEAEPAPGFHVDYNAERNNGRLWLQSMNGVVKDVDIKTKDNYILIGHLFKQRSYTEKWAIVVHGYQSEELLAFKHAEQFYNQGFNVLTYQLRAHDNSEGKYIGMGFLDKDDLIQWTNYVIDKDSNAKIAYHGTSMGGATVLMASGMKELPTQVQAIIDDCAYSSVEEIFALELKKRFNISSKLLMRFFSLAAKIRAGYSLEEGELDQYLKHNSVPTLIIHGEEDDFVPIEMSERNFNNIPHDEKEFMRVEIANHAQAHFVDEGKYYGRVFSFLDKYL